MKASVLPQNCPILINPKTGCGSSETLRGKETKERRRRNVIAAGRTTNKGTRKDRATAIAILSMFSVE